MLIPNWDSNKLSHIKAFTICKDDILDDLALKLPKDIYWLNQVHGNKVLNIDSYASNILTTSLIEHINNNLSQDYKNQFYKADASFTLEKSRVCVVKTADCIPILLTNKQGDFASAIHAGWRGLASGIIEQTVLQYLKHGNTQAIDIIAWLGPAICQQHYEVDTNFHDTFIAQSAINKNAFKPSNIKDKWQANIIQLAANQLVSLGVDDIIFSDVCTYCDSDKFHSYRRDGEKAGRLATVIWLV